MLRVGLLFLGALIASTDARTSPNAELVEELIRQLRFDSRLSNNIQEDASLDVPGLIKKYGYPLEVHSVTTEDGYILEMHRIPHGRDNNNQPSPDKPAVLLMHGLTSSSADWVIMGPGCAFAYILAEEGYDVWMGNARGNFYSRKHIRLNPDSILSTRFWEFSWEEIGSMDLPAKIDYILNHTGQKKLHYVGHSQGTTSFFVMGSLRPEFNEKIISMHAFAPVAFMAYNQNILLRFIASFENQIETIAYLIGMGEFAPNNELTSWLGQTLCKDEAITQTVCSNILFLIGGYNPDQLNATMLPAIMGHAPAGASVRQLAHYGQSINDKDFRRYDFGTFTNLITYGRARPPKYEVSQITAPVFMHYGDNDPLAEIEDVYRLHAEIGPASTLLRVPLSGFNHLDFVWAIDAKTLLYDRVINLMRAMERN